MKYLFLLLLIISFNCRAQEPKVKPNTWISNRTGTAIEFDTIKVIMQVSDTAVYRGAANVAVVWLKGYAVVADDDIYYLDIIKKPLPKSYIVWLVQRIDQ